MNKRLILASASPRRHELLSQMGLRFEVFPPQVDEDLQGPPGQVVVALAQRKAGAVAARFPEDAVLAADTLVAVEGQVLGKPDDLEDARRMLRLLSGRWHEVHSGVCLQVGQEAESAHAVTRVKFVSMTEDEIQAYCDSGEPMGKAGAYAIQGLCGMYIEQIEGSYTNVVGLPTALVRMMLKNKKLL